MDEAFLGVEIAVTTIKNVNIKFFDSTQATYLKKSPSPTENKTLPGALSSDLGKGLRCFIKNGETRK